MKTNTFPPTVSTVQMDPPKNKNFYVLSRLFLLILRAQNHNSELTMNQINASQLNEQNRIISMKLQEYSIILTLPNLYAIFTVTAFVSFMKQIDL